MKVAVQPYRPQGINSQRFANPATAGLNRVYTLPEWASLGQADRLTRSMFPLPTMTRYGKILSIVTFAGLNDPLKHTPALQMKVRGVTRFQAPDAEYQEILARQAEKEAKAQQSKGRKKAKKQKQSSGERNTNINKLAASNWRDGQPVTFKLNKNQIQLFVPGFGQIGGVDESIATHIMPLLENNPKDYRFELSNVVAGNSIGASTIGLRVNLLYTGQNKEEKAHTQKVFDQVLNDTNCMNQVMLYQPPMSPDEVLEVMLGHEEKTHGPAARQKMREINQTILKRIQDPKNRRILLLGHCVPDMDTLGSVLGLKHGIHLMDPTRLVDCAVDDKLPGLYRAAFKDMDEIKHPYNPEKIVEVQNQIQKLRDIASDTQLSSEKKAEYQAVLNALETELAALQDPNKRLDPNQKYDLVIVLDVPTPKRFTNRFKQYFENARDVIYIDHHPHRIQEWQAAAPENGLDIDKAHQKKLAWVADSVPAAAQMVVILINQMVDGFKDLFNGKPAATLFPEPAQQERLDKLVAASVGGIRTDTGEYSRTANFTQEEFLKPVQKRLNYYPEGMAKALMDLTDERISKKWFRDRSYELPNLSTDLVTTYSDKGKTEYGPLQLGVIEVDYEQMTEVLKLAQLTDPKATLLDVQNAFKMGSVMGDLRPNSSLPPTHPSYKQIAVLICQDRKAGEEMENDQIAPQNGLRLSFRSGNGTNYAQLLAGLFGGGGHPAAAGARVDLPGVELTTPLAILVNGQKETNSTKLLEAIQFNLRLYQDSSLTPEEQKARAISLKTMRDPEGKPCREILAEVIRTLRDTETA